MRVTVDQERCIGSGECVVNQPAVFRQDDEEGFVVLILDEPPARHLKAVRVAAAGCPVQAIHIE